MFHGVPPPRIALAQVDTTVGDFAGNAAKIREVTGLARGAGATLVVFPELALSGYPPRDFLDMPEFLARAGKTLAELAAPAEWSRGVAVVIGFPEADAAAPPPGVYNAAALVEDGAVRAVGRKSLLPTYDVFDEARYFLPARRAVSARSPAAGLRLGLSICEDIWNDKRFWQKPRYQRDPIGELSADGAELVVNISASPYVLGKPALRERMVGAAAARLRIPIAYVNQVGGNDALIFDGGSMLIGIAATQVIRRRLDLGNHAVVTRSLFAFTAARALMMGGFALASNLAVAIACLWVASVMRQAFGPVQRAWLNRSLDSSNRATLRRRCHPRPGPSSRRST